MKRGWGGDKERKRKESLCLAGDEEINNCEREKRGEEKKTQEEVTSQHVDLTSHTEQTLNNPYGNKCDFISVSGPSQGIQ